MFIATGAFGVIGALPLLWKLMVVTGAGAAGVPPTVLPLAVANTFQVSFAAFWK